ncbi:hypothetical protein ABXS75_05945 [Roseburia hominis]
MRRIKQFGAMMVCLAMVLTCVPALPTNAEGENAPKVVEADPSQSEGEQKTVRMSVQAATKDIISYKHSESKSIKLIVKNTGEAELKNIKVAPPVSEDIDVWPFEIANKDYTYTIEKLAKGEEKTIEFALTARENVCSKYYKLVFTCSAETEENDGMKLTGDYGIYVKTVAKPKDSGKNEQNTPNQNNNQDSQNNNQNTDGQDQIGADSLGGVDAGGVMNADPVSTGGGDSSTAVPRVIVTGFSTEPGEVKAGTNFKLIIHLKNTSKKTTVSNMLFDLSSPTEGTDETASPAFLPSSGSSSIYLEKIKAGGTQDISIELNAKADLAQKPYSVDLSMKYEDGQGGQFESTSAVSIPVKQEVRYEFSEFEISPQSISVGEEANIMCQLYNLGRVKLYNVKAKFEGQGIKAEEVFLGNIESGATASIDGMLLGEEESGGMVPMKMTLSYEDESGNVTTSEEEFQLEVMAATEDMPMEAIPMEEEAPGLPIIPIVAAVLIIAAVVAGIIIYNKKKKRRLMEEEEGLVDEFDRLTEDEPREP